MIKVLYLEDDLTLLETITEFLEDNGFDVSSASSGNEALELLYANSFDILIFDVNLPDMNGFELLKNLRDADISTPAIFTTTLNDIDSLDKGYSVGADDYIKKPFELKELLHRVNVIIKREYNTNDKIVLASNIVFDIKNSILLKDEKVCKLTLKEIQLLKLLIKNKNKVTPIDHIYSTIWSGAESISDGSLRSYIRKLRTILGTQKIINIKKQGYKLVV